MRKKVITSLRVLLPSWSTTGWKARRSGAGKVLLQAAEELAAERGKARMDLTTARTNKPAQAAYESLGWVRDELFYAYSKSVDA
jgi:ribosomal protein S18 acetylase RimI-like enzyme